MFFLLRIVFRHLMWGRQESAVISTLLWRVRTRLFFAHITLQLTDTTAEI